MRPPLFPTSRLKISAMRQIWRDAKNVITTVCLLSIHLQVADTISQVTDVKEVSVLKRTRTIYLIFLSIRCRELSVTRLSLRKKPQEELLVFQECLTCMKIILFGLPFLQSLVLELCFLHVQAGVYTSLVLSQFQVSLSAILLRLHTATLCGF